MRQKGKSQSPEMTDKPKSGRKNRFRFRGGGNKKENGLLPSGSRREDTPDDVITGDFHEVMVPLVPRKDVYQLSNADVINGTIGSEFPDKESEDLVCTCPHPHDEEPSQGYNAGYSAAPYEGVHNYRNGGTSVDDPHITQNGNHSKQVSVTAVIEGGSPVSDGKPDHGGTASSNDSESSTSICSVRPKVPSLNPVAIEAAARDIINMSPPGYLGRRGNTSPSSQSLVSVASSTVAIDIATDSPHTPRLGDRPKQTLGDIIQQIEVKSKSLLEEEEFTTEKRYLDLQFLAHQSRYNSDIHIKRRLIAKLVDSSVVDIFLRVFNSVHTVDYLSEVCEIPRQRSKSDGEVISHGVSDTQDGNVDNVPSQTSGIQSVNTESSQTGDQHNADNKSLVSTDDIELHGANNNQSGANNNSNSSVSPALRNLRAAITLMWNTTDKSPILCEECIKKGLIQTLLEDLRDSRLAASELKDQQRLYLVKGYLGILNNIVCFFNDAREIFREAGAIKILQPYLKSALLLVKTKTIMLLSYIINESENDVINASDKNIGFTIKMLEATLEKDNHYSKKFGFWAVEVAAGLNRLACFEANKDRIVQKGALQLYLRLIQHPSTEDEQLIATQGLWIFAYSDAAKGIIRNDRQILEALRQLQRTTPREEIKRATTGALWVTEGRGSGIGAIPKSPRLPAGAGHIFISYHWTCKQFAVRLRDKLRSFGYKVFVDTDNMGTCGLPLDTMLEALEKTCIMLVCMTQKYKDSPSCRNEVEQAVRLRRDIIPLRLQQKYNPDGWLASVISSRLIFDFSREENLENVTASLVRELGPRGRSKSALAAAAAAASVGLASRSPSNQSVASGMTAGSQGVGASSDVTVSDVAGGDEPCKALSWSEAEVTHWLTENNLACAIEKFQTITGELLVEMKKMHQTAPESFYTMLRSELGFDWITQLRFTSALDKL